MKRIITLLVLITVLSQSATAKCSGFYIMRKKDHMRPTLDPGLTYINDYNACCLGPDEKVIYLTFDAGYENGNVERIVDTLDSHCAKGTFFVLENIIKRNTSLIIKMAEHGHTVANHSMRHKNMSEMTLAECEAELSGLEKLYNELTGCTMAKLFRPPEGNFSRQLLENTTKLGYKTVFWSFAYADWDNNKQPSPEYAVKLILDNTHNGEIILLHPTSKTNADILDRLLTEWENMGYRFGNLSEIA
ncbi:MAG: polysaccharide deacetylase family protein [Clostridia bacterium]|nr:polysaccharide deacetylase family protein [Clostridia bacterium]